MPKRPAKKGAAPSKSQSAKISPRDVLKSYPGGVSPHKHYPVRLDDEIVDHAKLLFFVVTDTLEGAYSLDAIATTLRRTYPGKCNTISRMTVSGWIKRFKWREQREEAVQESYRDAKDVRERQEVYKKLVTGKFGVDIAELNALIHKPASGLAPRDIQRDLRDNERMLLEATQNRLGLVLVELRSLNGTAFNELTRRGKDNELMYRPRNRREILDEYKLTSELLIRLYGIRLLQKMAGLEPDNFDGKPQPTPVTQTSAELSDELLRQCNVEFPPELASMALQLFSGAVKGGGNVKPATVAGGADAKDNTDAGSFDESDSTAEAVEVEPAKD